MELITISNSQEGVWDRCEFKWHINYGLGYVPRRQAPALSKGIFGHSLLQVHYEARRSGIRDTWPLVLDYAQSIKFDSNDTKQLETFRVALRFVERYLREFAPTNDTFRILDVERHFVIELMTPKGRPYKVQGYYDLLIELLNGELWVLDHKTGQKFKSLLALLMDAQMSTYIMSLREQGYPVKGAYINQLNSYDYKDLEAQPVEKLYRRDEVYRNDAQLENQKLHIGKLVDEMYDKQESQDFRKSFRYDCDRCAYVQPCLKHTKGQSMLGDLYFSFKKREARPTETEEEDDDTEDIKDW